MRILCLMVVCLLAASCGDDTTGTHSPRPSAFDEWTITGQQLGSWGFQFTWSGPSITGGSVVQYDSSGNEVARDDVGAGDTDVTVSLDPFASTVEVIIDGPNNAQSSKQRVN